MILWPYIKTEKIIYIYIYIYLFLYSVCKNPTKIGSQERSTLQNIRGGDCLEPASRGLIIPMNPYVGTALMSCSMLFFLILKFFGG